jgi:hypothetical protein
MTTTSEYFSVKLPETLSEEQLVKIYEWGKQHCVHSNVLMQGDGYLLLVQRSEERDTRARQRLMLTNLRNWSIDTSKQKGWLTLLTAEEYRDANSRGGESKTGNNKVDDERSTAVPASALEPSSDESEEADQARHLASAVPRHCSAEVKREEAPLFRLRLPPNLLTQRVSCAGGA